MMQHIDIKRNLIHMKRIWLVILIILPAISHAQNETEMEMEVGDTLIFGKCEGDNFQYIDLYRKTRVEETDLTYDSITGEGFYEYFFSKGDFDVHRLPADYSGRKCVISAVNVVTQKDGSQRLVIFATVKKDEEVVWIEAEKAFGTEEVTWLNRKEY